MDKSAAQIAYEAYRNHTGGISLASGQPIPEWPDLKPEIQAAWAASASALESAGDERMNRVLAALRKAMSETEFKVTGYDPDDGERSVLRAVPVVTIARAINETLLTHGERMAWLLGQPDPRLRFPVWCDSGEDGHG